MLMPKRPRYLLLWCFILLFLSCASDIPSGDLDKKPDWILNSHPKDGLCGVGYAKRHIKGLAQQRRVAIENAAQEIAMQKGGRLRFETGLYQSGTADNAKTYLENVSFFVGDQKVTATIVDVWMDDYTKELYILMCTE